MKNHFAVWGKPNTPEPPADGHGPNSAAHRLTTGNFCQIEHVPRFKFSEDASFFMIGSCFATNLSKALASKGKNVLSSKIDLDSRFFTESMYSGDIALIKFTPHSFLNEIQTNVLGKYPDAEGLIALPDGRLWNPQLHKIKPGSLEDNLTIKGNVRDCVSRITDADVVFVTLGLTETWFDRESNVALNENPFRIKELHGKAYRGRFEFRNLDFAKALATTEAAITTIRENAQKDIRFVVTVSPIPLLRTFEDCDVITANSYSKSTLRSVAHELYKKFDFVDYFPSYEIVMNSPRELAWRHDQRHVTDDMVRFVIDKFFDCHMH